MDSTERLMTYKEAAETLGISVSYLQKMRRAGKVRVVRLGRRAVRVSAREVARLCKED